MRYAQLVMGPAGSGKSTYCAALTAHAQDCKRTINVVNLDPAAEFFNYQPIADIRDLIQVDDVMEDEELRFGPNGGLVFAMEFLLENLVRDGESIEVYKDPVTDSGKTSKKGRLVLVKEEGNFRTIRKEQLQEGQKDELVTVFRDGVLLKEWSWVEVKGRQGEDQ